MNFGIQWMNSVPHAWALGKTCVAVCVYVCECVHTENNLNGWKEWNNTQRMNTKTIVLFIWKKRRRRFKPIRTYTDCGNDDDDVASVIVTLFIHRDTRSTEMFSLYWWPPPNQWTVLTKKRTTSFFFTSAAKCL